MFFVTVPGMEPAFNVKVGRDYYGRGHFYVPQDHAHHFAGVHEVEIRLPGVAASIHATVDRPPNEDQTWILGSTRLRDWFQK